MRSGLSVLIVDDDPGSLHLLETILRDAGFAVQTAERPSAALRSIELHPPDLLVTDLRMPEMSGLSLLQAARRLLPDLCCLIITGFATNEATSEAFRAGVQDLILKPINIEEVRARVVHAAELVLLRRVVRALRAAHSSPHTGEPGLPALLPACLSPSDGKLVPAQPGLPAGSQAAAGWGTAPRARELEDLSALPGSLAPVDVGGREEVFHRLERLGILLRHGVITAAEFEERKRSLLARV